MINWFDMPAEGLSNGGLFEIKELTATENKVYQKDGEVYNKVTVNVPSPTGKITITENGTDIDIAQYATADVNVEGGGGSSDFSTAEVILSISGNIGYPIILPLLLDGDFSALVASGIYESGTYTVAMYKGTSGGSLDLRILEDFSVNTSGDISYDESEGLITITGDCTITIS